MTLQGMSRFFAGSGGLGFLQMRLRLALPAALAAVVLTACSNRRSAQPAPDPGTVTATSNVLATVPADGASDVEPDFELLIELANPFEGEPAEGFCVREAGRAAPGQFTLHDGNRQVRWRSPAPLPRGAVLELEERVDGGMRRVATFAVRDARPVAVHEVPGLDAVAAFSWPNGRRALLTKSNQLFEVAATRLVERFVTPPINAFTYGDGRFGWTEYDVDLDRMVYVTTDLLGDARRVAIPGDRFVADVNSAGDAVVFVPADVGQPSDRGIWTLSAQGSEWQWRGPLALAGAYLRQPCIDEAGVVSYGYVTDGRWRQLRYLPGNLVPEQYERDGVTVQGDPQIGMAPNGDGLLAWVTEASPGQRELRLARFAAGVGFAQLRDVAASWSVYPTGPLAGSAAVREVVTGATGSAVVFTEFVAGGTPEPTGARQFLRLEPDGWTTEAADYEPQHLSAQRPTTMHAVSRGRGELWVVYNTKDRTSLLLKRCRPYASLESERLIYEVSQPGNVIDSFAFAFDDLGRAVLAVNELAPGSIAPGARVLVLD